MALHPLELPREAALLFRVVALQKRLLKALAPPALSAASVTTGWVQQVWHDIDPEWVPRFCERKHGKRTQLARLQVIAAAPASFRQALFDEFCRQNRSRVLFEAGGDFCDLTRLANVDAERKRAVREFFKVCYARFSHSTADNWPGLAPHESAEMSSWALGAFPPHAELAGSPVQRALAPAHRHLAKLAGTAWTIPNGRQHAE